MASLVSTESSGLVAQQNFQLVPPTYNTAASADLAHTLKSRRKRTSPRDHAILEAAYLRNSKPDKAERALIVSEVELGEKEVQIWFQNRRQNDRRKSKPLQPHELVAHLRSHTPLSCQVAPVAPPSTDQMLRPSSLARTDVPNRPVSRASSIQDLLNPSSSDESSHGHLRVSTQTTCNASTPPSSYENIEILGPGLRKSEDDAPGNVHNNENTGEHGSAKKRGHAEMIGLKDEETRLQHSTATELPPRSKEPLKRSASMVRLAMTVDGAVKIRTNNEPTPSPEKPKDGPSSNSQSKARSVLARSKSAMSNIEIFKESGHTQSKQMASGFGRSRDSRTWEFFCDSTAQDALSKQAEAETAGSAVSAIHLVRSISFKSRSQALSPSVTKTNGRSITKPTEGKRKLSRAKSSLGRLQGYDGVAEVPKTLPKNHTRSPSGDSDKENWAPGTTSSINPLRRTEPSINSRPILQENEGVIFRDTRPSTSTTTARQHGLTSTPVANNESPSKQKAKGEELDCIQGLLSLSQGAWK